MCFKIHDGNGMALSTEKDMKPVMPVVAKAIPHIFRDPTSVFLTAPARDILFDGVLINCTIQDFAARALCNVMKAQGGFEKVGKSSFKFSFFGPKNGTLQERLRLKRGVKDVSEIGRIVSYKDQPRMTVYNSPKCNEYLGTDGSIFPPFLKDGPPVQAYAPDLCRCTDGGFLTTLLSCT
ncbi:hypothetical protein C0J52_27456 [Blattella germanica]|nr:hypothetical protein C0J52_27456 [Blattella germanica]